MSRLFGNTRQVAFVTKDLDAAINAMITNHRIGPFFVMHDIVPEDYRYYEEPAEAPRLSLAFAFTGDLNIEIIQQHNDAPSAYRDYLAKMGDGVQHFSSWTGAKEEYDTALSDARAEGYVIAHEGRIGDARFAYVDTKDPVFGMCFEIAEGLSGDLKPIVEGMMEAARDWDGSDPIRPFA